MVFTSILTISLLLLDQLTKFSAFEIPQSGIFISSKKFIGLQFYKNYNLIFNIKINQTFLLVLAIAIMAIILFLIIKSYKDKNLYLALSFSLVLIGAASNLFDRIYHGYVVDFISFFDYSIFNLADVYIFTGAALVILYTLKTKKTT